MYMTKCEFSDNFGFLTKTATEKPLPFFDLLAGGADLKVPSLRIGEGERGFHWMYESGDIIGYLEGRFANSLPSHTQPACLRE